MSEQFALWLTVIMTGVLLIGVTWILTERIVELRHRVNKLEINRRLDEADKFWEKTPKRKWVGLTDKEVIKIANMYHANKLDTVGSAFRAVEDKLKEKNT